MSVRKYRDRASFNGNDGTAPSTLRHQFRMAPNGIRKGCLSLDTPHGYHTRRPHEAGDLLFARLSNWLSENRGMIKDGAASARMEVPSLPALVRHVIEGPGGAPSVRIKRFRHR